MTNEQIAVLKKLRDETGAIVAGTWYPACTPEQIAALTAITALAAGKWRCFHCDFATSDRIAAEIHFGDGEGSAPICLEWSKMTEDERLIVWADGEQQLLQAREDLAASEAKVKKLTEDIDAICTNWKDVCGWLEVRRAALKDANNE